MKLIKIFLIFSLSSIILIAQDSTVLVVYDKDYDFNDGLFITFDQVLSNSPVLKSNIVTKIPKDSYDFYDLLVQNEDYYIIDDEGNMKRVKSENTWGYADNGRLFVFWEKKGTIIPVLGSISHFLGLHTITDYPSSNNALGYYSEPTVRTEIVQYIIDFSSGLILEFNIKNIDVILIKDKELYQEWANLSKRKKKKLIFVYLQKFNEQNPLMLPKN
ncbi:MAG: hypothetical protein JXR68_14105 [Bacteroidales bacterium]|nr:hypothetical protein [Bacteroidales bacterium]